jgi:DNA-binding YbaB/EbfC family protein
MDFLNLAKQASQLQAKMQALQAELDSIEVEGTAGGDLVKVRLSVDASLWKAEEREIAEDLIVAAHADARRKAEALLQEKMKELTGGLPLPPGLKLF